MNDKLMVPNLAETIRDRVRGFIFDAIPDDQIDKMIEKEYKTFFETRYEKDYNGRDKKDKPLPSYFEKMVQEEMMKQMDEAVKSVIQKKVSELEQEWEEDFPRLLGPLVEKLAPSALQSVIGVIVSRTLESLRQNTY